MMGSAYGTVQELAAPLWQIGGITVALVGLRMSNTDYLHQTVSLQAATGLVSWAAARCGLTGITCFSWTLLLTPLCVLHCLCSILTCGDRLLDESSASICLGCGGEMLGPAYSKHQWLIHAVAVQTV